MHAAQEQLRLLFFVEIYIKLIRFFKKLEAEFIDIAAKIYNLT